MPESPIFFQRAITLLPRFLRTEAEKLPLHQQHLAEELRLRIGLPATVLLPDGEITFSTTPVDKQCLTSVLDIATGASVHTAKESLRQGFITAKGGCRVGICGTVAVDAQGISGIRNLSSICIRIPKELPHCADAIYPALQAAGYPSTLIVSPPGCGKTSLLRELIRRTSTHGLRVALADERSEIAAVWEGVPQFDVGLHTDILTGGGKSESIILLLRAMNPQIIALDEITAAADIHAIENAANCGVRLFATAHGLDIKDLQSRNLYQQLLEKKIFQQCITIEKKNQVRRYHMHNLI